MAYLMTFFLMVLYAVVLPVLIAPVDSPALSIGLVAVAAIGMVVSMAYGYRSIETINEMHLVFEGSDGELIYEFGDDPSQRWPEGT